MTVLGAETSLSLSLSFINSFSSSPTAPAIKVPLRQDASVVAQAFSSSFSESTSTTFFINVPINPTSDSTTDASQTIDSTPTKTIPTASASPSFSSSKLTVLDPFDEPTQAIAIDTPLDTSLPTINFDTQVIQDILPTSTPTPTAALGGDVIASQTSFGSIFVSETSESGNSNAGGVSVGSAGQSQAAGSSTASSESTQVALGHGGVPAANSGVSVSVSVSVSSGAVTPLPTSLSPPSSSNPTSSRAGIIGGSIAGCIIFLCILCGLGYYYLFRSRRSRTSNGRSILPYTAPRDMEESSTMRRTVIPYQLRIPSYIILSSEKLRNWSASTVGINLFRNTGSEEVSPTAGLLEQQSPTRALAGGISPPNHFRSLHLNPGHCGSQSGVGEVTRAGTGQTRTGIDGIQDGGDSERDLYTPPPVYRYDE